jgi:hypothetical protein
MQQTPVPFRVVCFILFPFVSPSSAVIGEAFASAFLVSASHLYNPLTFLFFPKVNITQQMLIATHESTTILLQISYK